MKNVGTYAGGTKGINISSIWQYFMLNEVPVVMFTGVK